MKIPKVFISYSHDSQAHKEWTMNFAIRLRNSGVDAILDQWELQPGGDIPHFMEQNLASADRVLMICTGAYVAKANSGAGGVGYEKMIVTADLMKSIESAKVIPIIRQDGGRTVPTFLSSKYFIDFSGADNEYAYDELVRTLVGAPLFVKPPISHDLFKPVAQTPAEPTIDNVRMVMQVVVSLFEKTPDTWILYAHVLKAAPVSRILLDFAIDEALQQGLLARDSLNRIGIRSSGKEYAVLHKLIRS
ncbi:toll/interleukin-1 receptor domain-containing protein [Duganella aceris]|uniref:Toll/interleukin-1 receptor domain-containing protein n=1 Tax=Duganella aceris TaxID=2703883 RepID=A0ABX0FP40_9BURK|nr:toll/interleukin-1 receptor domain-containing protein [Duganella aceris]NGZ86395.1 toll/interleukin-1 receptor domain-containing protein [Duganella aceris]